MIDAKTLAWVWLFVVGSALVWFGSYALTSSSLVATACLLALYVAIITAAAINKVVE